jgi:hypothetical protein
MLDPLNAARLLHRSENGVAELARQQALDDPRVMEELLADGDALRGEVVTVDPTNRVGRSFRPLITLIPEPSYPHAAGATLYWTERVQTAGEVVAVDAVAGTVTLQLSGGMGGGQPGPDLLPGPRQIVLFSPHGDGSYFPPTLPDRLPWTHTPPIEGALPGAGQDS